MELNVLKKFSISTLKREDLAGNSGVDVLYRCAIGGIENIHDNMVALVLYILTTTTILVDKDSGKRHHERDVEPSAMKARKGNEGTVSLI